MASKEAQKRKREEYEMQLFGFHSRAVYATLRGIVYDRIKSKTEKLCDTIEKTYQLDNDQLEILKANKKQLINAYTKGATPHLQNIENVVNKFIAVPNNVLLEEDKCQRVQYTSAQLANMKQNLEDLQERAKRATMVNAALKEEQQIQKQFEEHEEIIGKMSSIVDQGFACPNTTSKLSHFAVDYKKFITEVNGSTEVSKKQLYNNFDNLHCNNIDTNTLNQES